MIALNDVALPLPDREICESIERDISIDRLQLLFSRSWPGFGMVGLATPTMYRPWPPLPVRLNRMYWPNGATRWGSGLWLIDAGGATDLHDSCFSADGSKQIDSTLVLSSEDDLGDEIEAVTIKKLIVFPLIPLYRVLKNDGSSDLGMYLLYVADKRITWWDIACPDFGISETAGVAWEDVFSDIGTALGLPSPGIDVDDVNSKYLEPSRAINLTGEPVPPVLDAACYNCGQRLIYKYDGTVATQNFKTALDAYKAERDGDLGALRTVRAGGPKFTDLL